MKLVGKIAVRTYAYDIFWENLKGRDHLEIADVEGGGY